MHHLAIARFICFESDTANSDGISPETHYIAVRLHCEGGDCRVDNMSSEKETEAIKHPLMSHADDQEETVTKSVRSTSYDEFALTVTTDEW